MELKGCDAKTMTKVLAAIDSISPLNGMYTSFIDYDIERLLKSANMLWDCEDGDLFEDWAMIDWK